MKKKEINLTALIISVTLVIVLFSLTYNTRPTGRAAAPGCDPLTDPGCRAEGESEGGGGCTSDAQCPLGKHCNVNTGQCVQCTSPSHCSDGNLCTSDFCINNQCSNPPKSCPGQVCNPSTGACVDCLSNTDCSQNKTCVDNFCIETSNPECYANNDCNDNNLCTTDTCQNPGRASASCSNTPVVCTPGLTCNPATGQCVSCLSNTDCPQGQVCNITLNQCKPAPACSTNVDCKENPDNLCTIDTCSSGSCSSISVNCTQGRMCNSATGVCEQQNISQPGCTSDSDCETSEICDTVQGICVSLGAFCDDGTVAGACSVGASSDSRYCIQNPCKGQQSCPHQADFILTVECHYCPCLNSGDICLESGLCKKDDTKTPTHTECLNNACTKVLGEGKNLCTLDKECVTTKDTVSQDLYNKYYADQDQQQGFASCSSDADCDDSNICTLDACDKLGTTQASCFYTPISPCCGNSICELGEEQGCADCAGKKVEVSGGDSCTDADGGQIFSIQGSISGRKNNKEFFDTDTCLDKSVLKEYYCDGNEISSIQKECKYGCSEGACSKRSFFQFIIQLLRLLISF